MNKRITIIIAAMGAIALVAGIKTETSRSQAKKTETPGEAMSEGDGDNANARAAWELMRLADPATGKIPVNIRAQELAYAAMLPKSAQFGPNARTNSVSWNWRGPYNVGGRTRALAIDANNENIILAGSVSGGMYRSTDGGATWTKTTGTAQSPAISSIVQDTRAGKTNIWYCSTGEYFGPSASATGAFYLGNGLYKSTDGGITWVSLAVTAANMPQTFNNLWDVVHTVTVDPSRTDSDVVYAAAIGTINRSKDGGQTWKTVRGSFAGNISYVTDVAVTSSGVVYATLCNDTTASTQGINPGIWRSTDGLHWVNITPAGFPAFYSYVAIGICAADENQVYFISTNPKKEGKVTTNFLNQTEGNSLWKYHYLSGDGSAAGGRWIDLSNNLPNTGTTTDHFYSQGGYDLYVKVKPNDTNAVFIGGCDMYRSTDGFFTANNISQTGGYAIGTGLPNYALYPNNHPDQHALVFYKSNPNHMICGNDGGLWATSDNTAGSVAWTSLNNAYNTMQFYALAIDHSAPNDPTIIGGAQDNGTWFTNSTNASTYWTMPGKGDGGFCAIASGRSNYYMSLQNGKTYKYALNNSGIATGFRRMDPIGGKNYLFTNPYALDPNNNDIMYFPAGKHLWRNDALSSIPLANKYDSVSTGWTAFADSVAGQISAIAVSTASANIVYLGTTNGKLYRIDSANTANARIKALNTTGSGMSATANVSCIAVDPNNADIAIITFSNYNIYSTFYTSTGGKKWSKIGGNLEKGATAPSVRWAAIMHVGTDTAYFLATSTGLYATNHLYSTHLAGGDTTRWVQQAPATIGNVVVDMVDTRASDGLVVAGTHGGGIYSANVTDASQLVNTGTNGLVAYNQSALQLHNYPNPFAGQTNVDFTLPQSGYITLKLFDISGREVHSIYTGTMDAGHHTMPFSATGMPAGTYFCVLVTGKYTTVQKMLIAQ